MLFALRVSLLSLALSLSLSSLVRPPVPAAASSFHSAQTAEEPVMRALMEKYFALYAAKDLDGLTGLWSGKSPDYAALRQKLQREFAAEDYRFSPPAISRLKVEGERAGLRAAVKLTATDLKSREQREQQVARNFSLIRENGAWKVWRSAPAEDDLAEAMVKARTEAERAELLAEEKELAPAELARALRSQGYRFYNQGGYPQALAIFRLALSVAEQTGDRVEIALTLNGIGNIHRRQGDSAQALESYQRSLAICETLEDKAGVADALGNIGLAHHEQGNYAEALEYIQKCLALSEAIGRTVNIAPALNNIGRIHRIRGDYARTLEYYHKSLALFEARKDKAGIALALNNIGSIYLAQGGYAQALEAYHKSLAIREALGDKAGIASTLRNLASAHLLQGDYAQALQQNQRSLALSEATGNKTAIASAFNGLGAVHYAQGNYAQAMEHYQKCLALWEELGYKAGVAIALKDIGELYQTQGQHSQALDIASRAAALAAQIGYSEALWEARLTTGDAYLALKHPAQARLAFEEAITVIETLRANVAGGGEEQQRYFESKVAPYHAMVDLLTREGQAAEALTFAERAKARVLLDVLQMGRVNIAKAMTAQEQEQKRKLNSQLVSLNTQVSRETARPQPNQARLTELKAQLQKARLDLEAFQTNLYAAHSELKAQRGEAPPLKLDEAGALLPDAASVLLEYVVTEEQTFLFAVTKAASAARTQVFTLPIKRAELAQQIETFRQQLAARDLGFRATATKLYNLLLKPAQALLKGKIRLIIVPDGKLWELPFQALPTSANRYLLEDAAISYAPSLTVLREMTKRPKPPATAPTLLALGNPTLGKETVERATFALRGGKLEPLPEAEAEVKTLGQLYGAARSRIYTGAAAREDRAKAEAGQMRVLHFATHGILNNASPLYSHLVLTQSEQEDGLLEAWELMQMDLQADLVVLSACETARGRIGAGEGVIGLSWALFVAGVPATVVSQWKVESASTRDLMLSFHRQLRAPAKTRATKAEALRQAALRLMKNPATSHPFYWAGFVLVGDGR